MGEYNVSCCVSNLPIEHGDEIMFMFLITNHNKHKLKFEDLAPFEMELNDVFRPLSIPIPCSYDESGKPRFKEKEHPTIKLVEKLFNSDINNIMMYVFKDKKIKNLNTNSKIKNVEFLNQLTGTFILKEVYDECVKSYYRISEDELIENKIIRRMQEDSDYFYESAQLTIGLDPLTDLYLEMTKMNPMKKIEPSISFDMERISMIEPDSEYANLVAFCRLLKVANIVLMPVTTGTLYGNLSASKAILEASFNVLRKKLERYPEL